MPHELQLRSLSDDDRLRRLSELLRQSRRTESDLVAHIGEVDQRRLYAREASPSMFSYCTERLHLSEAESYLRITVARAARHHPSLLKMLADGRLHLRGIAKLAPHLTSENRDRLLERAAHKSKRQIDELVAELIPRPDVPALMPKLPQTRKPQPAPELCPGRVVVAAAPAATDVTTDVVGHSAAAAAAPARPALVEPLAPQRFRVQFTASAELHAKLERLQALMRSSVPDGDLAALIEVAVTEKVERLESRRFGTTRAPRKSLAETDTSPSSRYVPAAVRRAVYERDRGQCRYVDERGRRCPERHDLEFHHDGTAFGRGGDHSPENLRLACRTHNAHLAEREYGADAMERYRRSPQRVSEDVAGSQTVRAQ